MADGENRSTTSSKRSASDAGFHSTSVGSKRANMTTFTLDQILITVGNFSPKGYRPTSLEQIKIEPLYYTLLYIRDFLDSALVEATMIWDDVPQDTRVLFLCKVLQICFDPQLKDFHDIISESFSYYKAKSRESYPPEYRKTLQGFFYISLHEILLGRETEADALGLSISTVGETQIPLEDPTDSISSFLRRIRKFGFEIGTVKRVVDKLEFLTDHSLSLQFKFSSDKNNNNSTLAPIPAPSVTPSAAFAAFLRGSNSNSNSNNNGSKKGNKTTAKEGTSTCYVCGRNNHLGDVCRFRNHPYANLDANTPWKDSLMGKCYLYLHNSNVLPPKMLPGNIRYDPVPPTKKVDAEVQTTEEELSEEQKAKDKFIKEYESLKENFGQEFIRINTALHEANLKIIDLTIEKSAVEAELAARNAEIPMIMSQCEKVFMNIEKEIFDLKEDSKKLTAITQDVYHNTKSMVDKSNLGMSESSTRVDDHSLAISATIINKEINIPPPETSDNSNHINSPIDGTKDHYDSNSNNYISNSATTTAANAATNTTAKGKRHKHSEVSFPRQRYEEHIFWLTKENQQLQRQNVALERKLLSLQSYLAELPYPYNDFTYLMIEEDEYDRQDRDNQSEMSEEDTYVALNQALSIRTEQNNTDNNGDSSSNRVQISKMSSLKSRLDSKKSANLLLQQQQNEDNKNGHGSANATDSHDDDNYEDHTLVDIEGDTDPNNVPSHSTSKLKQLLQQKVAQEKAKKLLPAAATTTANTTTATTVTEPPAVSQWLSSLQQSRTSKLQTTSNSKSSNNNNNDTNDNSYEHKVEGEEDEFLKEFQDVENEVFNPTFSFP